MDQCIIKMSHIETCGGIFDEIVDCTYVLLCCGKNPQREENVYRQLNILKPSKHIIIVYNSGYKLCKYSANTSDDLRNAQLYIFNHALDNNYKRIYPPIAEVIENGGLVTITYTDFDSID